MGRQTKRELPPGRMAHHQDSCRIETVALGNLRHKSKAMGDVFEATRPAAARIANPAVLQVPGRNSLGGKRSAEMAGMRQVILCAPKASMDVHGDRKWPTAFGQAEIAELVGVAPVGKPH